MRLINTRIHKDYHQIFNEWNIIVATFNGPTARTDADAYIASKQPEPQPPAPILPEVGEI